MPWNCLYRFLYPLLVATVDEKTVSGLRVDGAIMVQALEKIFAQRLSGFNLHHIKVRAVIEQDINFRPLLSLR